MKWYEEVTVALIADFKRFAQTMVFRFCGPNRIKLNKERMHNLILTSQCRGSVSALDELMKIVENEEQVDKDFVLAQIHLMRMNLWNEAALLSATMKKMNLETAMQVNPNFTDLIKTIN